MVPARVLPPSDEPGNVVRVALAVIVVLALTFVGVGAVQRMGDRRAPPAAVQTADSVAAAWADALRAADVDRLEELASDRTDLEELRAAHTETLPALGTVRAAVTEVALDGNEAVATVTMEASPVEGATWPWEVVLDLVRDRGRWSVEWTTSALHPRLEDGWRLRVVSTEPSRAPILDREGRALSRTGAVVEIGVRPGRLPDRSRTLLTVADSLPAAFEPLQALLDRDDLRDDWYYPVTTVPLEVADEAWPDLLTLPGLIRRDSDAGVGPARAAGDVVGEVGRSDDGELVGTSGLERLFDERLQGAATTEVELLDPDGDRRGTLFEFQQDVRPGVTTTLDLDVQQAVEEVLTDVDGALGVVVLDAGTGGVTAVASRPASGFVRALEGRYPPALVAGVVPLAAAILDGASPQDPLACPARGTAGGVTVTSRRDDEPARATLADALTGACDVGVARLGAELGGDALGEAARVLGITQEPALPVPAVGLDLPPTSSPAGDASAAIGHGRVQSSALGAATIAASVARGAPTTPVLLTEDVVSAEQWPAPLAGGLREAMRAAGAAGEVQRPGVRVAAVRAASGQVRGDPAPTTGWWVGFLEGDAPDLAIAVVVEGDEDGGRATAIAARVVEQLAGG